MWASKLGRTLMVTTMKPPLRFRRDRSAVWLHKLHGASSLGRVRRIPLPGDSTSIGDLCPGRGMTRTSITASLNESVAATDDV
jgi:hypothetical protein